jgi:hypothetical protein
MVWDRTGENCGNDYMTWKFLTDNKVKDVPLVKHMSEFADENGGYNFVVMARAKAVPLHTVWDKLTRKDKRGYAKQMAAALRELRSFTAEFPQRVDGSPLWDCVIGNCNSRKKCIKVGRTAEEWLGNMEEELSEGISRTLKTTDKAVIGAKLAELKVCVILLVLDF